MTTQKDRLKQSTKFRDLNGKKIYVGDVLSMMGGLVGIVKKAENRDFDFYADCSMPQPLTKHFCLMSEVIENIKN